MTMQTKNAAEVALIPRDVLFGNPEKAQPAISPDGKFLAYLAPNENNVLNVWVRTIGSNDDRIVTSDNDRGVRVYFWQMDNKHILYIQDENGDENWHIFQTNLETGHTRDLTPFDGALAHVVAIEAEFPDEILIASNKRDARLLDVYRLNLKDATLTEDTTNPGDVAGWAADHKLNVRVAHVLQPDGSTELRMRDNNALPWRPFMTWGADESGGGVMDFTPDNKGVLVASSVDANSARLLEVNIADGKQKVIAEDSKFDVGGVMTHPTKHHVQAVTFLRERNEWTVVDETIKDDFEILQRTCAGNLHVISRTLADTTWIVQFVIDTGSSRYYVYDRQTKKAEFLFTAQPALDQYKLSNMEPVSFTARDGMKLYGYLTLPVGTSMNQPEKKVPMILLVHGGPWARDNWGYHPEVQWLANRGYAVLQINFRGSTGYGKDYCNAGDRQWGAKMHDDLIDGKRWAIEKGFADPNKIAIYGGSYGGYATLVGLAFTPDEFVCGVDIVGPSSIITLINSIPPYWEPLKALFDKRVGKIDSEQEFLQSRSPLFKADQIKAPLLIGQGAHDPRVKQAESDQIVEAMRKNGKEVEYVVFEDEGHGFAKPDNRLKFYTITENFLAKHLAGRSQ